MPIVPKVLISEPVILGGTVESCKIRIYYTGTIVFEITADGDATTPTWDTVTLLSGVLTTHIFTVSGDKVMYRIVGGPGVVISSQQDIYDQWSAPGIEIQLTYA